MAKGTLEQAQSVDRKFEALTMRKKGFNYVEIAAKLGYSNSSGALAAVRAAMKEMLQEPSEEVRDLEIARLDAIINKLWDRMGPSKTGVQVIDRVIKLMERRARYLGLDKAEKINPMTMFNLDVKNLTDAQLQQLANGEDVISILMNKN